MKQSINTGKVVFPAGLLLEDRDCLVVGGGRVAAAKIHNLLDAGARVTVLSPELGPDAAALSEGGRIRHIAARFSQGDTEGYALVYAATSDPDINREVVLECGRRDRLVCAVDSHWPEGSFVTPAVIRRGNITISVSTGGRSCRRSKLIKANLIRHLDLVEMADILIIGTSHQKLPLEKRELFHFGPERIADLERQLSRIWGVHEFFILTTCNRSELWAVTGADPGLEDLILKVLGLDRLSVRERYLKRGEDAFHHGALLAAGLYSQTPGESHIVAQVKERLAASLESGAAGVMIQEWVSKVLHVSKHIRQASLPILKEFEIEDLVFSYAEEVLGELPEEVLVVGTGAIGRGVVEAAGKRGISRVWCYHRNRPHFGGEASDRMRMVPFEELEEEAARARLLVFATASPHHILTPRHRDLLREGLSGEACGTARVILDLSLPRNVDPALKTLAPAVVTADLDDLKHWYRRRLADLDKIFSLSDEIVREHREDYAKIIESFQGWNEGK